MGLVGPACCSSRALSCVSARTLKRTKHVAFGIAVTQPRVEIDGHPADRSESEICDEEEEHRRGVLAELGPPNPQSWPC